MTRFAQIHMLTSYPPSNLNRDDLGRPKTAVMGGATRLRVSSQSLKRAWRTSEIFENAVKQTHMGVRTKRMGVEVFNALKQKGVSETNASKWAQMIAKTFGKLEAADKEKPMQGMEIKQLAHFSPEERAAIERLVEKLAESGQAPTEDDLRLLRKNHTAADIALFGRMLADAPEYNTEAAAQVAHAISVHRVAVEDDFFTAVDDLNVGEEDMGAGHMGETEFAAGLFYLYICIDCDRLVENLSKDTDLAGRTLEGLVEAAAKVSPTGKQNSFASRAYASFILSERGPQQPRSLSVSFLKPVTGEEPLLTSVRALEETRANIDKVYGACSEGVERMNAVTGEGSLEAIAGFVAECVS